MAFDTNIGNAQFWAKGQFPVVSTGQALPAFTGWSGVRVDTIPVVIGANPYRLNPVFLASSYLVLTDGSHQEVVWVENVTDNGGGLYSFQLYRDTRWSPIPQQDPERGEWVTATGWASGTQFKPYLTHQHMRELADCLPFGGPSTTLNYQANTPNHGFGNISANAGYTLFEVSGESGASGTASVSLFIGLPSGESTGRAIVSVSSSGTSESPVSVQANVFIRGSFGDVEAVPSFTVNAGDCKTFEVLVTGATVSGNPHVVAKSLDAVAPASTASWGEVWFEVNPSELTPTNTIELLPGYRRVKVVPTDNTRFYSQLSITLTGDAAGPNYVPSEFHVIIENSMDSGQCLLACDYVISGQLGSLTSPNEVVILEPGEYVVLHALEPGVGGVNPQAIVRWETSKAFNPTADFSAGITFPVTWSPNDGNDSTACTKDEAVLLILNMLLGAGNSNVNGFSISDGSLDGTAMGSFGNLVEALNGVSSAITTLAGRVNTLENQ